MTNLVGAHLEVMNTKPSAFISISLSAVLEGQERKPKSTWIACLRDGVAAAQYPPSRGALRFTEYDYFQEQRDVRACGQTGEDGLGEIMEA